MGRNLKITRPISICELCYLKFTQMNIELSYTSVCCTVPQITINKKLSTAIAVAINSLNLAHLVQFATAKLFLVQ